MATPNNDVSKTSLRNQDILAWHPEDITYALIISYAPGPIRNYDNTKAYMKSVIDNIGNINQLYIINTMFLFYYIG